MHFGKQLYRIGDIFKFRVFILNNKLLPYTESHLIQIKIYDSADQSVKTIEGETHSEFGFYEHSIEISETVNTGKWKIEVTCEKRSITKHFYVQKRKGNSLETFLRIPKLVSYLNHNLSMTIYVKSTENKLFTGTASILVTAKSHDTKKVQFTKQIKTIDFTGSQKSMEVNFKNDLYITSPTSDMILSFNVSLVEKVTQETATMLKDVEMKHNIQYIIKIIRKKFFKPGFEFPINLRVENFYGIQNINSTIINVNVEYTKENKKTGINFKTHKTYSPVLQNGQHSLVLQPPSDAIKITINCKFDESSLTDIVNYLPIQGLREYLDVHLQSNE